MIFAQVRSAMFPSEPGVEIAFCLVDAKTAGKILNVIESSKETRYAPTGSRANFVELLPTGEPVFILSDNRKAKAATKLNITK